MSGGTDNHLVLLDVSVKGLTGAQAADGLDEIGVTVNKNAIPFDKNPPAVASGIRLGTPALTTRGLKPADMETVGNLICDFLDNPNDEKIKRESRAEFGKSH